jgi:hypothetical protein
MMTKAITAVSYNIYNLPDMNGGAIPNTPVAPIIPFYDWQSTSSPLLNTPTLDSPRTALPLAQVPQQPSVSSAPALLPQVPAVASGNGASVELNQLLNSTGTLATDVVNQSVLLEQAQKQVEQQKASQQQQLQVNQLQQQNAILTQQLASLQQQTISPANPTIPVAGGGVASSNPYMVGLGSLGSYATASAASSLIFPTTSQMYSPTFSTAGMNINQSTLLAPTAIPATTAPVTVSSTPAPTAITGEKTTVSATPSTTKTGVTGDTIADTAKSMLGYNSRDNAPGATNKGRLACAWFVNEVLKKTHGKTFPESGGGVLNVDATIAAMKSEGAREVSASELKAGDIVYVAGKHIGIVGDDGGKTLIHNSSKKGESHQTDGATFPTYKGQPHKYIRLA